MNSKFARVGLGVLPILFLALAPAVLASAQEPPAQPMVLSNPDVNYPVHFDISPPLRDTATEVSSQKGFHQASPVRYPKLQQLIEAAQQGKGQVRDGALQTHIGPLVSASIGLNLLGVGNGFPGYSVPDAPSDVNLAVGDTQVVQWVNVSYAVFDKTTGAIIAGPILGNAFWSGFGGPCQTSNSGDIIAQWDKIAHRWLMTQNVFSSPYMTCVAVSTTPDATGTYYRFAFTQPGFPDYPKWGIWPDAYYQSQNNFGPSGSSFVGAYACAYERAKLLVGDSTAKQICFQSSTFDDSLLPGDLDSAATLPPSGQAEVFVGSIDNGTPAVYQYLFHVDFTTPSNSTFTGVNGTMPIPGVASFSLACGGFSACIPQHGVSDLLDSLGDRLMYRLAYRNFRADHQTWLVSHSVTAGSSVGERWYEFRAPESSTSLSVYQQGTFAPDGNYRWTGSIAMDSAQDIALGYSVSSSTIFPSISYTGRVATDPLGTMETEASIVSGAGSQSDTSNRWGDYTSMAIDEADDCTFWYTNEYYTVTASFDWSTRLASIKFSGCGGSSNFTLSASPASLSIQQGNQGTSTITTTISGGFNSSIGLSASGVPSGTTVGFNPNPIPAPGSGSSTMTMPVGSSTPTGTYPITVTGNGGGIQQNTTVTLTVTAASSFTLSASPASLSIQQGNQGTSTITTTISGGFNSSVSLSASGVPSGTTVGFNPNPIPAPGSGSSTMTITVGSSTPTGTYPITVTGNGGGIQQNATVTLTVTAQQQTYDVGIDFRGTQNYVSDPAYAVFDNCVNDGTTPQTRMNSNGQSITWQWSQKCNLAVNESNGVDSRLAGIANVYTASGGETLTLTVPQPGAYYIGFATGNAVGNQCGGGNCPNFIFRDGSSGTQLFTVNPNNPGLGHFIDAANNNWMAAQWPASNQQQQVTLTGTTLTVSMAASNAPNIAHIRITSVQQQPNFTISASPASLSIQQGNQGTSTITTTVSGGFNSAISLSASGAPSGTTVSFNPSTIPAPGSGSSTMTITVASNTPTGTYPITVTGNGGGIQQNATVTLTVTAAPNFTISASPASLSIQQGNQGTSTITTTISNGFNSAISLSASGMPSGTTVGFNPNPIPAPGSGSSTMTITVGSSTPTGTYPITVTGNGGGIQQNATVTLTVTAQQQTYDVGIDFRGTQNYVSDPAYAVFDNCVNDGTTPQTRMNSNGQSITWQWSQKCNFAINQSNGIDPRLAGIANVYTASGGETLTITVPQPGTYNIGFATGNAASNQCGGGHCPNFIFRDGSSGSQLFTVNPNNPGLGHFIDAASNNWTAAQWPASNQGQLVTLTGTTLTVSMAAGNAPNIAHIRITSAQQQPNFSISASPASLSVQQGTQGTSTITTTISNGFNSAVALSASGAPSGTTVSFNPSTIPAPGAGTSTMTITVGASTPGTYPITVTGNGGGVQQNTTVTLTVTQAGVQTDVITYHYDVGRQGQNSVETVLTPANVNSGSFGSVGFFSADGKVDAQPLYVSGLFPQNALIMVTEHGSVYAFNADSGAQVWRVSTLAAGETTSDDHGCGQISPEIGITSTPVIDRQQGPNGAIYVEAMSKDSSGNYHHRLHALDLKTGAELFAGPVEIKATYPGTGDGSQNGQVIFAPGQFAQRASLLEVAGTIYIAFSSHCDARPYTGWVMAYDAHSLAQTSVIDVTPNGSEGAIWMAGNGLAADSNGNIYFLDGNGTFETTLNSQGFPVNGDYGNAFIKLSTSGGLAVADYFNMYNTIQESDNDQDLGSGGAMVLPDLMDNNHQVHHLAVGAGKDTNIYVVNRDNMGKFNPNNDSAIYQELDGVLPGGVWANPAYFNNTVYYGSVGNRLKAFPISNAMLAASPSSQTATSFGYPGTTPAVSANGTSNAIVWAVENSNPAVLHAYDATNLAKELYNSNQAGSRDHFGPGNKFIAPVIVNGKVFVGTQTGVAEFGLLH